MSKDGHWIVARAILSAIGAPLDGEVAKIDTDSLVVGEGAIKDLKREAGGVRFQWTTRLPFPNDPDWTDVLREAGVVPSHRLELTGLRDGRYAIFEGTHAVGAFDVRDGSASVDLRSFAELSSNRRASELGECIRKRERIMSPAWLDFVGHKRPDTAKGLPLVEAKKQASALTAEIIKLGRPVSLDLSIRGN
jgi:hypothetical protein